MLEVEGVLFDGRAIVGADCIEIKSKGKVKANGKAGTKKVIPRR